MVTLTGCPMNIRPAAVAGQFYDANKTHLKADIDQLIAQFEPSFYAKPRALIVPHAGYIYSGSTAAQAYGVLSAYRNEIRQVILLGPAHRVYLDGMALPSVDAFHTPLGDIKLDRELMDSIASLPNVVISDEAHRLEHSLEVQLPFLQSVLDEFSLVPIVIGDCPAQEVAAVIDYLAATPRTLFVISSDLSHFHSYEMARQLDASTCNRIQQKASDIKGEQACGARAINGLMASEFVKSLSIDLLAACNSGDTAGDKNRVVGYGAFLLH